MRRPALPNNARRVNPWRFLGLLGALVVVVDCSGGSGDGGTTPSPPVATTITIAAPTSTVLVAGTTLQLVATVKDQSGNVMAGQSIAWQSSSPTNASVSASGAVTGLLVGTASIAAATGLLTSNAIALTVTPGPAAAIVKQHDVASGILVGATDSIAAEVTDAGGNAVSGTTVTFAVTSGGGSLSATNVVSGSNGIASVHWTMGTVAGAQTATATAASLSGSPILFNATALAGATTTIAKASTDSGSAPAQSNIDSIRVKLTDQFGNPKSGEVVTFAATAGGGSVSPTQVTTGSNGLAAAQWTLGSGVNTINTATATRAGLVPPTVTFTTTTTAAVVATVTVSGARTAVVDSGATIPFNVTAAAANGNPIVGAALTMVARSPAATVSNGVITGAERGSTFIVATSTQTPTAKDSLFVTVGIPGFPVVVTDLARLDLKADTTFTVGIIVNMRASGAALGATTVQVTWDPTLLTYVSDVDGTSGVGATVNTGSTSTGALTMSMASTTGFTGAVQLRKVTFTASAAAGRTGNLSLFVSELAAAVSFTSLLANTVVAIYPLITR